MHRSSRDIAAGPASSEAVHWIDDGDDADWRWLGISLEAAGCQIKTYISAERFLAVVPELIGGCAILNLRTPIEHGLRLLEQLRSRNVHLPTVVVAEHGDVTFAVQVMKAGAVDVVERPYTDERMIRTVSAALAAGRLNLMLASRKVEARACLSRLSQREHDVLRELMIGRSNKLVAHTLSISPRTVEIHRANMMHKLGMGSLAETLRLCIVAGLDY